MGILVIISAIIVILSVIIIILFSKKILKNDVWFSISLFCMLIFTLFGLIILPLVVPVKLKIIEIEKYDVIKAKNAIILDLSNSNIEPTYPQHSLYKFNSYNAVTSINDSTKFFVVKEKSFYNVEMNRMYVWSNPPYTKYNKE